MAGQRIMFDHFTLDGVENTGPNFNTYVILPSIDALQEFQLQTGVYPAEFGRNATQINVLTKSGGNQYHTHIHLCDRAARKAFPGRPGTTRCSTRPLCPPAIAPWARRSAPGAIEAKASPWLEDNQWVLDVAGKEAFIVGTLRQPLGCCPRRAWRSIPPIPTPS